MANEITNSADTLDSRKIEERIKELEEAEDIDEDDKEELINLKALKEDVGNDEEQECGICFINECYFEDYARELAEDLGEISRDTAWPANCIDWERAANELRIDYSELEFDGISFYYRS